jgi:hypothetical protein
VAPANAPKGPPTMAAQPDPALLDHPPAFFGHLIDALAGALPAGSAEERSSAAHAALDALHPNDMIEAMLAARMIAAHHASMDGFRRAMQADIGDDEAVRLRNNAIAAARSFDAALRALEKRQCAGSDPDQKHGWRQDAANKAFARTQAGRRSAAGGANATGACRSDA